ncbi:MAG: ABC transporter permease [Treponema sp.]|jgi:osmoprotectant transport system permease protein|nr:ABC transporter permease [Treponema sp.]
MGISAFFIFFAKNYRRLLGMLSQHLLIVLLSLAIAAAFALPVGFLLHRRKSLSTAVIGIFSVLYSIPSLALFTVFLPITGIGMKTAVIVISIYAQFIMLRNTVAGFQAVNPSILEASRGMGLSGWEILIQVQLPLAAPVLLSGLRIAALSSIGITAIAATINSGGLGTILFEGIRNVYTIKIIWGVILTSALSFGANQLINLAENYCSKRARGERTGKAKRGPKDMYDVSL